MMTTSTGFFVTDDPEVHKDRSKAILREHPKIRRLIGRNPYSVLVILAVVALQLALAYLLRDRAWWLVVLTAYTVGAFANHSMYVMIHECAHNLVFENRALNRAAAIVADLPNVVPAAISFARYHLKHHAFMGIYDLDADLPSRWEARLIGNGPLGKALWLALFPFVQITRPPRLRIEFLSRWAWLNWIVVFASDLVIIAVLGPQAFMYLVFSLFFSIGLHPLGARWIQEHYVVAPPQETYSYYGPLNLAAFNVGYHNEHHDFPSVPWNRLPKIRHIASGYYDRLTYHTSWTKLLLQFLFDRRLSLSSRIVRTD
jgi:sphingolipid delta-4 desaturase